MTPKKKIRKAVIPAAGFGTRFLPQTKAMPKEMLPIVDKPIIQYVVEECVASGIEDIIMVTNWQKRSIEDHFDYPYELEKRLEEWGKQKELEEIRKIAKMANFIYIRQKGPYGNATPALCAEPAIEDEPFVVIWGDEFIFAQPPRLKQMIEVWEKYGGIVISALGLRIKPMFLAMGLPTLNR
jgi:UTP--glucose-1-phosphate uridylyltransferase